MAGIQTVTEQVYDKIYRKIMTGEYTPGMRLTIKVISNDIGVSSSPIREALTRLQQANLITYQPNIGMRVREYNEDDIHDMYQLMSDLDVLSLKYAISNGNTESLIKELRKNVTISAAIIEMDTQDWMEASDKFHTTIIKYAENPFLEETVERIHMHLTIFSNQYESAEENRLLIQREHENIVSLLEDGKFSEAEDALKIHVLSSGRRAEHLVE